jgi:hypothetical protein
MIDDTTFKIDECIVSANFIDGESVRFPYKEMNYDSRDNIYWYKGKSLINIVILDPNGNPQNKYKVFE